MYLIVTRAFPPELGGMQSLMWGLSKELSKNFMSSISMKIMTFKDITMRFEFLKFLKMINSMPFFMQTFFQDQEKGVELG